MGLFLATVDAAVGLQTSLVIKVERLAFMLITELPSAALCAPPDAPQSTSVHELFPAALQLAKSAVCWSDEAFLLTLIIGKIGLIRYWLASEHLELRLL